MREPSSYEAGGSQKRPRAGDSVRSTVSRPVFQRFVGAVTVGMALAATSGCSVPVDAVAGISVTGDGRLLGVMMVCGHQIDGATLYVDSADGNSTVTAGSWTADRLSPPVSPLGPSILPLSAGP